MIDEMSGVTPERKPAFITRLSKVSGKVYLEYLSPSMETRHAFVSVEADRDNNVATITTYNTGLIRQLIEMLLDENAAYLTLGIVAKETDD